MRAWLRCFRRRALARARFPAGGDCDGFALASIRSRHFQQVTISACWSARTALTGLRHAVSAGMPISPPYSSQWILGGSL